MHLSQQLSIEIISLQKSRQRNQLCERFFSASSRNIGQDIVLMPLEVPR